MGTPVVLADRVLVATTTTGTGTYAIGTAITGYLDPAGAGVTTGARLAYVVVDSLTAPTAFEIGEGIYTAGSPGTLTRAQIRRNTAGGTSAINWGAGTKYLMLAPSAANLPTLDTAGALTAPALSLTGNAAVGGTLAVTSNATIGTGLTVTSGGASITAGGLTVTAGGLSVGAGGASIAGNSTIIGDLTTYRSGAPTTGYHFFGNTGTRSIGFDGTNCVIAGMNVYNANGSFYLSSGGGFYGNTLRDYSLGQNTGLNLNDTTIDFIANGGFAGYVDSGGNINAAANFVVFSDRRLKQRIRRYGDGAAAVDAIPARRFERRDLGGEHIGFIAQEVAAQLPEAVTTTRDGLLALKEMPLIAALWQALQATRIELRRAQHRIEKLEARR